MYTYVCKAFFTDYELQAAENAGFKVPKDMLQCAVAAGVPADIDLLGGRVPAVHVEEGEVEA